MSTEQNYAPPGGFASPNEPSAPHIPSAASEQAQPHPATDERRDYFRRLADHSGATEYLGYLLEQVGDFADSYDPVPDLLAVTDAWLTLPFTPLDEQTRHRTSHLLRLVKFLTQLRSHYTCFAIEAEAADEPNQTIAGEGEDHD